MHKGGGLQSQRGPHQLHLSLGPAGTAKHLLVRDTDLNATWPSWKQQLRYVSLRTTYKRSFKLWKEHSDDIHGVFQNCRFRFCWNPENFLNNLKHFMSCTNSAFVGDVRCLLVITEWVQCVFLGVYGQVAHPSFKLLRIDKPQNDQ